LRCIWRSSAAVLLAAALVLSAGCGGGQKEDSATDEEGFRVPDSLLSPIESYGLTIDDYHPVNGGVMANKDIALYYPPHELLRFVAVKSFGEILDGYDKIRAEIGRPAPGRIVIIGTKDLEEYAAITGKEWWYYATIRGDTIICEPLNILLKRWDPVTEKSLASIGLTQRMAQMSLNRLSGGRIPAWLKEAIASYLADERAVLRMQIHQFEDQLIGYSPTVEELERSILAADDMALSRSSYFYAYRMLENLLEEHEFSAVKGFVRRLGEGATLDEASAAEFGVNYAELIAMVRPDDIMDGAGPLPEPKSH
jgi:hypothetical protein